MVHRAKQLVKVQFHQSVEGVWSQFVELSFSCRFFDFSTVVAVFMAIDNVEFEECVEKSGNESVIDCCVIIHLEILLFIFCVVQLHCFCCEEFFVCFFVRHGNVAFSPTLISIFDQIVLGGE